LLPKSTGLRAGDDGWVFIPLAPAAPGEWSDCALGNHRCVFDFGALFCRSNLLKAIIDAASRTAGLLVTFLFGRAKRKVTTIEMKWYTRIVPDKW